ncbi:unnamed protein product [Phytomonas sp. EM1]|nr:unnamed protein product [Phytomonas sp. EM1]|eukprot:CCW61189.1 unnamed protein product [Phytomonas sp. isolate EM1]
MSMGCLRCCSTERSFDKSGHDFATGSGRPSIEETQIVRRKPSRQLATLNWINLEKMRLKGLKHSKPMVFDEIPSLWAVQVVRMILIQFVSTPNWDLGYHSGTGTG